MHVPRLNNNKRKEELDFSKDSLIEVKEIESSLTLQLKAKSSAHYSRDSKT